MAQQGIEADTKVRSEDIRKQTREITTQLRSRVDAVLAIKASILSKDTRDQISRSLAEDVNGYLKELFTL